MNLYKIPCHFICCLKEILLPEHLRQELEIRTETAWKGRECEPKMTSWQPTANEVLPLCSNRAADMRTQSNWCYNCVFRTLFRRWRTIYQPVTQIGAAFWDSLPAIKNDVNEKLPGKKLRLQPESLFFPPTGKKCRRFLRVKLEACFMWQEKTKKLIKIKNDD